jgi:hypothetical protein
MNALTNDDVERSLQWQHDEAVNEMATNKMFFILKRGDYGITGMEMKSPWCGSQFFILLGPPGREVGGQKNAQKKGGRANSTTISTELFPLTEGCCVLERLGR